MIPDFIILIIAFLSLAIGSIFDLKTREIPDWLNFGLIFLGVGINSILSVILWDGFYILGSIFGLIVCFLFACLMFYTGQWGGGDAKMMMGLGALIGLELSYGSFLMALIVNIFAAGAVYGIIWVIALSIKNKKKFAAEFKKELNESGVRVLRNFIFAICIVLFVISFFFGDWYIRLLFYSLIFISIISYYLFIYA